MSGTQTASQRLKEIYDKRKTEDAEIEKLKKDAEAEDLETVKALIKLHGFTQTKLRGVFKAKATKSSGTRRSSAKKKTS